jgi:hypothetical protein
MKSVIPTEYQRGEDFYITKKIFGHFKIQDTTCIQVITPTQSETKYTQALHSVILSHKSKKCHTIYDLRCLVFEIVSPSSRVTHFSAALSRQHIKRIVRCTQDIQCTAGLSCNQMIMEHTHDKYCDMLLTLCSSQAGTTAWQ